MGESYNFILSADDICRLTNIYFDDNLDKIIYRFQDSNGNVSFKWCPCAAPINNNGDVVGLFGSGSYPN